MSEYICILIIDRNELECEIRKTMNDPYKCQKLHERISEYIRITNLTKINV